MKRYFVSDGYFQNGESRPKREVLIIKKEDSFSTIEYVDDKKRICVSNHCIDEKEC